MYKKLIKKSVAYALTASLCMSMLCGINASAKSKLTVKLNKKKITLEEGKKYKLKAKVSVSKATVKWSSSKKAVASVSKKGVVKAKKTGKAVVTAKATYKKMSKKVRCNITVSAKKTFSTEQTPQPLQNSAATNAPANTPSGPSATPTKAPVKITYIELENDVMNMKLGDTTTLNAKIAPAEATLSDCTITNSKDYVAVIDESGKITAKYIGTTFITITSKENSSISKQLRVNVTDDFTAPEGFDVYNEAIEHGELSDFNYPSDYRDGGKGHALIWFPSTYDPSKEYNLLLCLHGGSDTEYYWTSKGEGGNDGCKGDIILDNLYASGQMEDTIVVFPHGVINYDANKDYPNVVPNPFLTDFWQNHYLLEFEIVNNLLPYIQENYPVMKTKEHTAICGLSMGCAQSMEMGFKHSELFDYVGCFSAGPFEDKDQFFVNSYEDADKINNALKLLFFITGENDHLHDDSLRLFIENCNEYDLNNVFYEVKGVGHDDYCWDKALYTFMRYAFK